MSSTATKISRSIYISRLRRAFLLRVHPDRFRTQSNQVRKEQATLVQVLSDRLGDLDFVEFVAQGRQSSLATCSDTKSIPFKYTSYPYSIETKDGKLIKSSIQLNSSPCKILTSMSSIINFPPPPEVVDINEETHLNGPIGDSFNRSSSNTGNYGNPVDHLIWNAGFLERYQYKQTTSRTRQDRNLIYFLQNMDTNHIKERKMNRINASAAALVARRAFRFSAIDGTGLGWSSASLAVCLSRLTALYDEHKSKLRTKSFYPLRLVLSSDEYSSKLDLYGGVLRLNPAATPLQWLTTLQTVTEERMCLLMQNREALTQNLSVVEKFLNVKIIKGHSCENEEYHRFMERLASISLDYPSKTEETKALAMSPNNASLVIESEQACRRCKVRKDGNVEAGTGAHVNDILRALNIFASRSNEFIRKESRDKFECNQVRDRVVYELGVQSVKKVGSFVSYHQMSACLMQLLSKDDFEKETLRSLLAGNNLAITGR
ncbi:hypothetical protein HJC23_013503, partial [Cyclotella cryptica]